MMICKSQSDVTNAVSEDIRKLQIIKVISQDCLSKGDDLALNTIVKIEIGESPNLTVGILEKIANDFSELTAELLK